MRARFLWLILILAVLSPFVAEVASAQTRGLTIRLKASAAKDAPVAEEVELYKSSYALVIGIDAYSGGWPRLSNAVKDAELVAAEFEKRNFRVTLKRNLSSAQLKAAFEEFFIIEGADPQARLFVWFAGHGYTLGGEGYLVPADAPRPDQAALFKLKALPMRSFGTFVRQAEAKHAFAVFDACFAGTVFDSQRALPPAAITHATTRPVRQFLTSGDADQTVSDDGTFRELFLRALRGEERADANGDGFLTGTEIGLFLSDRVTNLTRARQTPRYGKLRDKDYDLGDFVLALGAPPSSAAPQAGPEAPAAEKSALDLAFWQSVKDSKNPAEFKDYLKQFPNGTFASLARRRAKEQIGEGAASPTPLAAAVDIEEMDAPFVVAKTTNLRAQPSAQSRQVGRLAVDDAVTVSGKVKGRDWYRIAYRGSAAYVFAPLLKAVTPSPAVPAMRVPRTAAARVLFLDATSDRVLFEKAADEAFEPGSMTKLMTVYMVFERLRDGRLSLDDAFPSARPPGARAAPRAAVPPCSSNRDRGCGSRTCCAASSFSRATTPPS